MPKRVSATSVTVVRTQLEFKIKIQLAEIAKLTHHVQKKTHACECGTTLSLMISYFGSYRETEN